MHESLGISPLFNPDTVSGKQMQKNTRLIQQPLLLTLTSFRTIDDVPSIAATSFLQ